MKCDELRIENACVYGPDAKVYLAEQVDAAIAELIEKNKRLASTNLIMASETIKDLLRKLRMLKRALFIALAYKAKYKKYWYCELLKQEGAKICPDNNRAKKYNAAIKMCQRSEVKCRTKAEEYK